MKEKIYITPECLVIGVTPQDILCVSNIESESQLENNEQFTEKQAIW
jgi:flagellar biogenesis protein FliO